MLLLHSITVLLAILKLNGVIEISWLIVILPSLIPFIAMGSLLLSMGALLLLLLIDRGQK